ncbi:MAG: hypothetical protein IT386_12660 [Deltaproteobacteria bacterium]|nr:hypothetical protein [Deltaproteobacteria bacterium]
MSTKAPTAQRATAEARTGRIALRRELERRGVSEELAERLASELAAACTSLTPEARRGALTGMALASAVHREHAEALRRSQRDLAEIERMMAGFATELKKVDEAVKILSTFVGRIREQSAADPDRIVH